MESDFRSMAMFRPSSSTCKFSSRVANRVSMLGLISILFLIQLWRFSSRALDAWINPDDDFVAVLSRQTGHFRPVANKRFFCRRWNLPWTLAPKAKATTIGFRVPPSSGGVNPEWVWVIRCRHYAPPLSRRPPTQAPPVSSPTPSTPGYPRPGWSRAEPFPSAHPAALARSAAACWYTRRRAPSALPHRFLPRKILAQPQPPYPSRTLLDCAYAGLTEWRISAFSRFGL